MRSLFTCLYICLLVMCVSCDWIENKGLWYHISEEEVDYKTAIEQCESMSSRLAVITNDDQNDFLRKKISGNEQPRWIGLSTMKTDYHTGEICANRTYVWNYDKFCLNNYTKFTERQDPSISHDLMGVTITHNGRWISDECINNYRFICQWECKTVYVEFNSSHLYNGIYMLDHYLDDNIVYINTDSNDYIEIYKNNTEGTSKWVLAIRKDDTTSTIADYESNSYVPYGEAMIWRIINGNQDIDSASFCIDCDILSLWVYAGNNEIVRFNEIPLYKAHLHYYTAVSGKGTAFIQYIIKKLTTCVNVTIQTGNIHAGNINACGYIFPYPDKPTSIDVNDTHVLYVQNECVLSNKTCIPERVTTSTDGLPHTSQSTIVYTSTDEATADSPIDPDDQLDILVVIIGATISVLGLITVVVLVLISIVRRRRRRSNTDNHTQIQNNDNDKYDNTKVEPHVYSQKGASGANMANEYSRGSVPSGAEYSYVDLPVRENKNIVTERYDAIMSEKKNEPLDGKVDRFLAPDYGALVAGDAHDANGKKMHNSPRGINAIYSQVKKPKITSTEATNSATRADPQNNTLPIVLPDSINMVKHNYNDDLQLCENDLYIHTTENDQQIDPPANHTYYNENGIHEIDTLNKQRVVPGSVVDCGYYNVGDVKSAIGEDDLELFENTTYESSK